MARRPLSERRQAIQSKMDELKKQLAGLEEAQIARVGKIARDAGLTELDLPEETLRQEFAKIVARFRDNATETAPAAPAPAPVPETP